MGIEGIVVKSGRDPVGRLAFRSAISEVSLASWVKTLVANSDRIKLQSLTKARLLYIKLVIGTIIFGYKKMSYL